MAGSSESAFRFLDTKNGAIAPVVIIHLLLQQPLFCLYVRDLRQVLRNLHGNLTGKRFNRTDGNYHPFI
mgnify:CR=1 FL=1